MLFAARELLGRLLDLALELSERVPGLLAEALGELLGARSRSTVASLLASDCQRSRDGPVLITAGLNSTGIDKAA